MSAAVAETPITPQRLLARCLDAARVHARLLDDAEQHALFVRSATPSGRRALARGPLRLPPFVLAHLERWHADQQPDAALAARIALWARHLELSEEKPPAEWAGALRVARSRARVADATLAHACVAVSVAFDLGDAALRRIARGNAPYDAVYACFALEIARLRSLADSS